MTGSSLARWAGETVGTALLVSIGTGTVVAAARIGGIPQWLTAIAWSAAVLIPILLVVRISGAHLNPAVTLALASSGRIGWAEVPEYWSGQFVGAFAGSGAVLAILGPAGHLGSTVPANGDLFEAFLAEAGFTAVLVTAVFELSDRGQGRYRWRLTLPALAVGISTYLIGPLTGSSLNPARTLAPAVLSSTYSGLWVYLTAVPMAALCVALAWRPRAVDIQERGPGRVSNDR